MYTHGAIFRLITSGTHRRIGVRSRAGAIGTEELRPRMPGCRWSGSSGKKDVSAAHIEAPFKNLSREGGMLICRRASRHGGEGCAASEMTHTLAPPSSWTPKVSGGEQVWGTISRPGVEKRKKIPRPRRRRGLSKNGPVHILTLSDLVESPNGHPLSAKGDGPISAGGQRPPQRQTSADGAGGAAPATANHPGGVYKRTCRRIRRVGTDQRFLPEKRRQQYKYFNDRERSEEEK